MAWKTYQERNGVQARKVTAVNGETVQTLDGPRHAAKGAYITRLKSGKDQPYQVDVIDAEAFEEHYKANTANRRAKQAAVTTVGAANAEDKGVDPKSGQSMAQGNADT